MKVDLVDVAEAYAEDMVGVCAMGDTWISWKKYETTEGRFKGATNLPADFYEMPNEALQVYDEVVFECDNCGWHCCTGELENVNGSDVCQQCADELLEEMAEDDDH